MKALMDILMAEQTMALTAARGTIPRQVRFPEVANKIHVAIGMRRVGKTTFLLQHMLRLLDEENVPAERILYINFEDDRLLPCSQERLAELLEAFYARFPDNHAHTCYLFLDEIQNVVDWELVIRRFFETRRVQIFISGSSAKMLSKEIATSLRGRAMATEIWPYNFQEFLIAQSIHIEEKYLSSAVYDTLYQQLQHYFECGGFPEVVHQPWVLARNILQNYVELVIMRDIVDRYRIQNITLIKYMVKALLRNTACGFSVHKFHRDLKSQKMEGSMPAVHDYLSYLEDAYFTFLVPLHDESVRKVQSNPRKTYTIDAGMVKSYSLSMSSNDGHLFENLIYLDLRRQQHTLYYGLTDERYEIDFITINAEGHYGAYQVVWDADDPETMAREQHALDALKAEKGIEGYIITPRVYLEKIWDSMKTGNPNYL